MPQVIASVKALIKKDEKFLFILDAEHKTTWDLPGGKIEYGETPEDALVREVKEETDLDISIQRNVGVWWFFSKNSKHQVVCSTYACTIQPDQLVQIDQSRIAGEQISEYKWLQLSEVFDGAIDLPESLLKLLRSL